MRTMIGLKKKKLLLLGLLVVFVVTVSGCGLVDRILSFKDDVPTNVDQPVQPPEEPQVDVNETTITGETTTVSLYFASPDGTGLVEEQRNIAKVEGIARETINELVMGPAPASGLLPTIPEGTALVDINIKEDGLCRVDFSSELVNNHLGGSTEETLTVYSIVNTLTQFPTVNEVQIMVDGQFVETLAGHVDVSQALVRNDGLTAE